MEDPGGYKHSGPALTGPECDNTMLSDRGARTL
jgi:hypothetical protein